MPNNNPAANPSLRDVLLQLKQEIMTDFFCHGIATIQSFDADAQTVQATMNYKRTYYQQDPQTGNRIPVLQDYPLIIDCPAVVLGGGTTSLTFPIAQGDECLILFNDRDIDNWFEGSTSSGVKTPRLHSFADAIALVGLRNSQRVLTGYDTARAVLQNGTTGVGVGASKIKLYNAITTLNTQLQNLCTQIQAITVTCASPGSPSSVPINAAAIASIATQIAGLLE